MKAHRGRIKVVLVKIIYSNSFTLGVGRQMTKCEFVVNLHAPCPNKGHQGEGDGEDNPEQHFLLSKIKTGIP